MAGLDFSALLSNLGSRSSLLTQSSLEQFDRRFAKNRLTTNCFWKRKRIHMSISQISKSILGTTCFLMFGLPKTCLLRFAPCMRNQPQVPPTPHDLNIFPQAQGTGDFDCERECEREEAKLLLSSSLAAATLRWAFDRLVHQHGDLSPKNWLWSLLSLCIFPRGWTLRRLHRIWIVSNAALALSQTKSIHFVSSECKLQKKSFSASCETCQQNLPWHYVSTSCWLDLLKII